MCINVEPGKILDGSVIINLKYKNFGPQMMDTFTDEGNNIVLKAMYGDNGQLVPYMAGKTNRIIINGEDGKIQNILIP